MGREHVPSGTPVAFRAAKAGPAIGCRQRSAPAGSERLTLPALPMPNFPAAQFPIPGFLSSACLLPLLVLLTEPDSRAMAQIPGLEPTYGTLSLEAGFVPDPTTVDMRAGGFIDAFLSLGAACTGFIATAPDLVLTYTGAQTLDTDGESSAETPAGAYPLNLFVRANTDTTLVVNSPDGRWHCDDDGGTGFNPSVTFSQPLAGQYHIWVGAYGTWGYTWAKLFVSEIYDR